MIAIAVGVGETLPDTAEGPPLALASTRDPVALEAAATHEPIKIGRFVLLGKLGSGGMGVVYAAYDEELDRRVALKLVHEQLADRDRRLVQEARAAARLSHPNVVAIHDVGTWRGQVFLAMEYVDGPTLRAWLAERKRSVREILDVFVQAARGLAAAHAAGVVHRDFKPENVLIGAGPTVRVVDFGLARTDGRVAEISSSQHDRSPTITRTGAVMGTPAYMAPEQHVGAPLDARADQFAFCVALWEALYGKRPFAGDSLAAIATAVLDGAIVEPSDDAGVPARLRRVLRRGLAIDPAARHPSMDALVAELERDPARRVRAIAALALGGCVLVGVGVMLPRSDDACAGGDERIAAVWGDPQREAITRAFTATERAYAATAARSVIARIDRQAEAWADMHRDSCEATRVRSEQSDELFDLRAACLDRRLAELSSLAELLAAADVATVTSAERIALVGVEGCGDADALRAPIPLPDDPSSRARAIAIQDGVARGGQLRDLGRYDEAMARAEDLRAQAEAIGHAPTLADAQVLIASIHALAGRPQEARSGFEAATWSAIAGRNRRAEASATSGLVTLTGYTLEDRAAAERWAAHARATVRAMGDPPVPLAVLEGNLGNLAMAAGERARAIDHFHESMRLYEEALGPDDARVGRMSTNLAVALRQSGDLDGAEQAYDRALAVLGAALGPGHPDLGPLLSNSAGLLFFRGRYREALARYREALAIGEAALPAQHPQLGHAHNNIGETLLELGEADAAEQHARDAIAIWERALGRDHALLAHPLTLLGRSLLARGDAKAAIPELERALALRTEASPDRAVTCFALAEATWRSGDRARARELGAQARRESEPTKQPAIDAWLADHTAAE